LKYVLDTNILVAALNGDPAVIARLNEVEPFEEAILPTLALAERQHPRVPIVARTALPAGPQLPTVHRQRCAMAAGKRRNVLTAGAGREAAARRAVTDLISLARLVVDAGVPESVSSCMRFCASILNGSELEPPRAVAGQAKSLVPRALRCLRCEAGDILAPQPPPAKR